MGEISAASREQAEGVGQVSEAVSHMDKSTQQNAALVEQSAAAAAHLQAQSAQLVQAMAVFQLDPGQTSATPARGGAPARRLAATSSTERTQRTISDAGKAPRERASSRPDAGTK